MPYADGLDSGQGGLRAGVVRTDDPVQARAPSALGHCQHTADAAEAPVECQLPAGSMFCKPFTWQLVRRGEERKSDRQVETGAFLLQLRRGEVDGDPASGPPQLGGDDAAPDALLGLLARAVRKPDNGERRRLAALDGSL